MAKSSSPKPKPYVAKASLDKNVHLLPAHGEEGHSLSTKCSCKPFYCPQGGSVMAIVHARTLSEAHRWVAAWNPRIANHIIERYEWEETL